MESTVTTSELHEAVWRKFKDMDITIAFPQLDLHLDEAALSALSALPRSPREGGSK